MVEKRHRSSVGPDGLRSTHALNGNETAMVAKSESDRSSSGRRQSSPGSAPLAADADVAVDWPVHDEETIDAMAKPTITSMKTVNIAVATAAIPPVSPDGTMLATMPLIARVIDARATVFSAHHMRVTLSLEGCGVLPRGTDSSVARGER
ncbi:hypothetical protein [Halosolutus gelatinilyticus]|uniref:hypothetical protein n=1 Tax=Halosolutus gelatinilyticus TaxID=2931975 RepID=UPI002AB1F412|nr:hypothetical protein [Halosolutus gelatinilyticus]